MKDPLRFTLLLSCFVMTVLFEGCTKDDSPDDVVCNAFLMLEFSMPDVINDIQQHIDPAHLYSDGPLHNGLVTVTHTTVADYLDQSVSVAAYKPLLKPLADYHVTLTALMKFEGYTDSGTAFDVLVAKVESEQCVETHNTVMSRFRNNSPYASYQPHVTIAYLQAGYADQYISQYPIEPTEFTPTNFLHSYIDANGQTNQTRFVIAGEESE